MKNFVKKLTASVLAAVLAATLVPAAALATEAQPEATTGNLYIADSTSGWGFYFDTAEDGTATITGSNQATGATSLTLPTTVTVNGCTYTITEIEDAANATQALFYTTNSALKSVALPSALVTIGAYTFYNCTALTSISIPASVWGINDHAFRGCSKLTKVSFQGDYAGYFGANAFRSCTALTEFTVPALLRTSEDENSLTVSIGSSCFADCTALKTVIFESGNTGGAAAYNSTTTGYTVFSDCDNITSMIFYCTAYTFSRGEGLNYVEGSTDTCAHYYTVDFFESEEAHQAAISEVVGPDGITYKYYDRSQALASITTLEGTSISSLLESAPNSVLSGTQAWYLTNGARSSLDPTLTSSSYAYVVSVYDLTYAWIEMEGTVGFYAGEAAQMCEIVVYDLTGSVMDEQAYDLNFYQLAVEQQDETKPPDGQVFYSDFDDPDNPATLVAADEICTAGDYTVVAVGTAAFGYEGTQSAGVTFSVSAFTVSDVMSNFTSDNAVTVAAQATRAYFTDSGEVATFNVLADASDEAAVLVAASLASLGGGVVVLAEDGVVGTYAKYALNNSGASELIVVESVGGTIADSEISSLYSTVSALKNGEISRLPLDSNGYELSAGTAIAAEDMAVSIYEIFASTQTAQSWGSTAIIASSTAFFTTSAAAQLAYAAQAPVFFTGEDGTLSSSTLSCLKKGNFEQVFVIGNTVSDEALAAAATAAGVTPSRVLTSTSVYENSEEALTLACDQFGASATRIVAVDASSPALVMAACSLAGLQGGVCLAIASTADAKSAQAFAATIGRNAIKAITTINTAAAKTSLASLYDATPASTTIEAGDTLEANGLLFTLTASGTLQFTQALSTEYTEATTLETLTYAGKTYTIEAFTYDPTNTKVEDSQDVPATTTLTKQTIKPAKTKLTIKKGKKATVKVTGVKTTLCLSYNKKALKVTVKGSKLVIKAKKKGSYKLKIYAKASSAYKKSATKTIKIKVK